MTNVPNVGTVLKIKQINKKSSTNHENSVLQGYVERISSSWLGFANEDNEGPSARTMEVFVGAE